MSARGGFGGQGTKFASGGAGGAGGLGRIRISVGANGCTLEGTFDPSLAAGCAPTATPQRGRVFVGVYPD